MNALLLGLTILSGTPETAQPTMCADSFSAVHDLHLSAIRNRDLKTYRATLGNYDGKMMILPDGNTWRSTKEVIDGHIEWFADSSWTFEHNLEHSLVSETFGLAVHEVRVNRPEKPGNPFLLTMVFAPDEAGCWTLIHDQNTPLPEQ